MQRTITEKQTEDLAYLMISMGIPREQTLDILTAIETPQMLYEFLTKLSEKHYEMKPSEVYEVMAETVMELQ